jgi:hypothetical protein
MINEPCVHQDFYRDAVAVVAARDREEALNILAARGGWRIDDLRQIEPAVYELREAALIFSDIR